MESLTLFAFFGIWVLLGVLAARFGVDSREGIEVQTPRRLWDLPPRDRPMTEQERRLASGDCRWIGHADDCVA